MFRNEFASNKMIRVYRAVSAYPYIRAHFPYFNKQTVSVGPSVVSILVGPLVCMYVCMYNSCVSASLSCGTPSPSTLPTCPMQCYSCATEMTILHGGQWRYQCRRFPRTGPCSDDIRGRPRPALGTTPIRSGLEPIMGPVPSPACQSRPSLRNLQCTL